MRDLPAAVVVAFLLAAPVSSSGQTVQAELIIPPAETHVIGDPILLYWRFKNTGGEPLGFMWEGCCRLNGRLAVEIAGQPVPPTPPGEALAHMFAKAERLDPGSARDFDTRLSDWVRLERSGTYQLTGQYTGVLPSQQPQVPRGLGLWRDAASTPPLQIELITPVDYLQQRPDREKRRGLALKLSGPDKVHSLQPPPLKLEIRNDSRQPQKLAWPQCLDLWVLDSQGLRVPNISTEVESPYEDMTLMPGTAITRDIPFGHERFEGLPFGDYRVFIDLRPGSNTAPRVPSTARLMRWELTTDDAAALVNHASQGSATGLRNPSLKLLRVHVADIGTALATVKDSLNSPKSLALAEELALAACLKPAAPIPGTVIIPMKLQADGAWQIASNEFARCANNVRDGGTNQIRSILAVRRHLGWQVGLELRAVSDTKLASLMTAAAALDVFKSDLSQPPQLHIQHDASAAPCRITPLSTPAPKEKALIILRLNGGVQMEHMDAYGAIKLLPDKAALESLITSNPVAFARATVSADGGMTLGMLLDVLDPLVRRGTQLNLHVIR